MMPREFKIETKPLTFIKELKECFLNYEKNVNTYNKRTVLLHY